MESVRRIRAMRSGIREGFDDLQLLDYRAGPAMRDDERQRVFMFRTYMNEMNVDSVDLGNEMGKCLEFCFTLTPVVFSAPVLGEFLNRRELHALRIVVNSFFFRPLG